MLDEDRAAVLEILSGATEQTELPLSSVMPMMLTLTTQSKLTASSVVSRVQYNSSFASTCVVSLPIQGNIRQLAFDRWNYMYPS